MIGKAAQYCKTKKNSAYPIDKTCIFCGDMLKNVHPNTKYCPECRLMRTKEKNQESYDKHVEKRREDKRKFYAENKDRLLGNIHARRNNRYPAEKVVDGLICKQCGEVMNAVYHNTKYCTECAISRQSTRMNKCYQKNKQKEKTKCAKFQNAINIIKSTMGCTKCGNKDARVLQFHHIYAEDKEYSVRANLRTRSQVMCEILKCDILCANCHIITHHEMMENR